MNPEFDHNPDFFGTQAQTTGPMVNNRNQRSIIPGVAGFRVYRLGTGSVIWTVRGLVTRPTIADLEAALNSGAAYIDGQLYDFTTPGERVYNGCLLTSYAPSGTPFYCKGVIYDEAFEGFGVWVAATVEWSQPEF